MSCCLFILFSFSLQSLFLFFGHASPLLDESQDFSIFIEAFFILFCCCRRGHLYFFLVVLDHTRASAVMEHDRICLFDLMWNLCTKSSSGLRSGCPSPCGRCFGSRSHARRSRPAAAARSCVDFVCIFFTSNSHEWVWALVLQSLPCSLVTFTAFLFIITSMGCRRPPVRTSMLVLSKTTPLVVCFAAALRASSFGHLRYSVNKCAFCFNCCCGIFSFHLIFCIISFVMYFIFFLRRLFLL